MISNPVYFNYYTVPATGPTGPAGAVGSQGPTGPTGASGQNAVTSVAASTDATIKTIITSPYLGQMVLDSNGWIRAWDGTNWQIRIASGTYTPTTTIVPGTGGTNTATWTYYNSGTSAANYGTLCINGNITFGSAGITAPSSSTISLPANFTASSATFTSVGSIWMNAANTGFRGEALLVSSTAIRGYAAQYNGAAAGIAYLTAVAWTSTIPAAWQVSTDFIRWSATISGTLSQ